MHPRSNVPFDKNKKTGAADASAITRMRKAAAESADYKSKVGFTNYTLGSSSKAGFVWSIFQQGLVNDYRNLTPSAPNTTSIDITEFSIGTSNIQLSWNLSDNTTADISFFTTPNADLSTPIKISNKTGQSSGTITLATTPIINNYYYATVTSSSAASLTKTSAALQFTGIPVESLPPDALGYDIIIVAGQSNGQGWGGEIISDPYETASARNSNIYSLPADNLAPTELSDSVVPQSETILYTSNGTEVGPSQIGYMSSYLSKPLGKCVGINFANDYIARGFLKSGRRVLLVQTCIAGVAFTAYGPGAGVNPNISGVGADPYGRGWWKWPTTVDNLTTAGLGFQNMMYRTLSATTKTYPGSQATNNRVVALMWQEGESEGKDVGSVLPTQYRANLNSFATAVRAGLLAQQQTAAFGSLTLTQATLSSRLMTFLVGAMTPAACVNGPVVTYGTTITEQAQGVASLVPRSAYVPNTGNIDNDADNLIHFSARDLDFMAANYATTYSSNFATTVLLRLTQTSYTISWVLPTPSAVDLQIWSNGTTNSNVNGTQIGSDILVASGTTTYSQALAITSGTFYYVKVLPRTTGVPIATSSPVVLPVLLTTFNSESNMFVDSSPTGRTITNTGSGAPADYYQVGGRTSVLGVSRTVMKLIGTTSKYFSVGGNFQSGSYTKTAWFKFDSSSLSGKSAHILTSSENGAGLLKLSLFWCLNSNYLRGGQITDPEIDGYGDTENQAINNVDLVNNTWYFVATVFDNNASTQSSYVYNVRTRSGNNIRIPNVIVSSTTVTAGGRDGSNPGLIRESSDVLFIGNYKIGGTINTSFALDDVRLYNTALTQSQIYDISIST